MFEKLEIQTLNIKQQNCTVRVDRDDGIVLTRVRIACFSLGFLRVFEFGPQSFGVTFLRSHFLEFIPTKCDEFIPRVNTQFRIIHYKMCDTFYMNV